ncbi:uncharacterized protein [Antedon mediterranea]|uniref:uncharacterized protein isoform X2 n=1 Tax=Antedon mediterranea TaxID=105859 RepID=UPI003AF66580
MSRTGTTVPLTINPLHRKIKQSSKSGKEFSKVRRSTKSIKPDLFAQRWSQNDTELNGSCSNNVRQGSNGNIKRSNGVRVTDQNSTQCKSDLLQVPRYERRLPSKNDGLHTRHIGQELPRRPETRSVIETQSPRLSNNLLHPHWSVAGLPSETYNGMEQKPRPVKSRPQARNVVTKVLKKRAASGKEEQSLSNDNVHMRQNNGSLSTESDRNSVFDRVKEFEGIDKCPNTNSNRRTVKDEQSHVDLNPRVIKNESQNLHHTYENQDVKEKEEKNPRIGPKPTIKPKTKRVQNVFEKKKKSMSTAIVHTYEEVAEDEIEHDESNVGNMHRNKNVDLSKQSRNIRDGAKSQRERSIVLGEKKDGRTIGSSDSPRYEDVYEGDDTEFDRKPNLKFSVYDEVFEGSVDDTFQIVSPVSPSHNSKPLPPPKPKSKLPPPYFVLERNSADSDTLNSPDNQSNGDFRQSLFHFQAYKTPYVLADTNGMIDQPVSPTGQSSRRNLYDKPLLLSQRSASAEDIFDQQKTTIQDGSGYSIPGSHLWRARSYTEHGEEKSPIKEEVRLIPLKDGDSGFTAKKGKKGRLQTHWADMPSLSLSLTHQGLSNTSIPATKPLMHRTCKVWGIQRKINNAFRRKENKPARESTASEDRSSVASEDSDGEINEAEHKKRLTEIRRRRSRSQYCRVERIRQYARYEKLFDYVVVVSLRNNSEKRCFEPYEVRRFPQEVGGPDKLRAIPQFCFPDAFKWAPVEQYRSETFSFVLTSEDGSRLYGYCRRLLPPGDGPRLPEVHCIISPIGCFPLYEKLLDLMEERRKITPVHVDVLLKAAIARKFPSPGMAVELRVPTYTGTEEHSLRRPLDSRLEQVDFDFLSSNLDNHMFIQLFASLLMERRIIMCSNNLEILSQCSQAAAALLYPFSWQHVYIPILPEKLIDMVCSPTPYIVGMLSIGIPKLDELPLDEALVIDLDARDFHYVVGDESSIIPKKLYQALLRALTIVKSSTCSQENLDSLDALEDPETVNAAISEVFIRFFVETCGHYLNYMVHKPDGSYKFDREGFLKAMPSKSIRKFLEVFTESQMFSLFIQEKEMSDEGLPQGLFEKNIREYEAESKNHARFGNKVKNFGKFIKDSGQRWNGMKIGLAASLKDRV